ncbi:hypothetical protein LSCM1_02807 [Leishmania martiniquensis]|uniref:Uncharacterized protein n=1 Tax=Leishmania martiniquensis TaxID=1580590 RepID=A0A836KEG8_9TRYP|nr:hypothetical protein LSCM1_02807 [Leishmania martiniquensis]
MLQRRVSYRGTAAPRATPSSAPKSVDFSRPSGGPLREGFSRNGGLTDSAYGSRGDACASLPRRHGMSGHGSLNQGGFGSWSCANSAGSSRMPSYGSMGGGAGGHYSGRSDGAGSTSSFLMSPLAPPPSYDSLSPGEMNSCGSMGSNGFGTMWGAIMPVDSMRMIPMMLVPASSLYNGGGLYGSFAAMYGLGAPVGSIYGMPPMSMMSSTHSSNHNFGGVYDSGAGGWWVKEGAAPMGSFFASSNHSDWGSSTLASASRSSRTLDSERGRANATRSATEPHMKGRKAHATAMPPTSTKIPARTQRKSALEAPTATTEAKKSSGNGNTVRALAVVTGAGSPVAAVPGKLEVVAAAADAAKAAVKGSTLRELRDRWIRGHCSTLVIACGAGQRETSLALMSAFVDACFARLKTRSTYHSVSASLVAIKDSELGQDLLKSGATYEKMRTASSPIYGPALAEVTAEEVADGAAFRVLLKKGMRRVKSSKDLVVCLCVLKQLQKKDDAEENLLVSALNVTLVAENLTYLRSFKAKSTTGVLRHLYRYAFYGGSCTVCATCVAAHDAAAEDSIDAVRNMSDINNSTPHSGSVAGFVDYAAGKVAKYRTALGSVTNPDKRKVYERSMSHVQQMLEDMQRLQRHPRKETAKVYSVKESA